jgi:hypothetical protein
VSEAEVSGSSKTISLTLHGTVELVIKSVGSEGPDKAQIAVEGADELYREIRIENSLKTNQGEEVELKPGAVVDIRIEAPAEATKKK